MMSKDCSSLITSFLSFLPIVHFFYFLPQLFVLLYYSPHFCRVIYLIFIL